MNSNFIKSAITKYKNNKNNFSFISKKNKSFVLDGLIKYTFDKSKLTCSCSKNFCEHIIFYLSNIFGIIVTK